MAKITSQFLDFRRWLEAEKPEVRLTEKQLWLAIQYYSLGPAEGKTFLRKLIGEFEGEENGPTPNRETVGS
jgi:hypothetical protein